MVVVSEESVGGVLVLQLAGRLDEATAPGFQQHATERIGADAGDMLLDLAHVFYINHHGLAAIVLVAQGLRERERRLAIAGVQDSVFPVFEMNGFAGLILLVPDREEGLRLLGAAAPPGPPTLDVQAP